MQQKRWRSSSTPNWVWKNQQATQSAVFYTSSHYFAVAFIYFSLTLLLVILFSFCFCFVRCVWYFIRFYHPFFVIKLSHKLYILFDNYVRHTKYHPPLAAHNRQTSRHFKTGVLSHADTTSAILICACVFLTNYHNRFDFLIL